MIQLQQVKLKIPHTKAEIEKKVCKILRISRNQLLSMQISRRSLDARRKPDLSYVYTLEIEVKDESSLKKRWKQNRSIQFHPPVPPYSYQVSGTRNLSYRPVIAGTGPAGLFCGYALAKMGYRPILLERGASVEERRKDVETFWKTGRLDPESNVQFGEGGAGTFSDGKLNTLVHDPDGRGREVLRLFVQYGAPEEILYDSKPHIGTDKLIQIVRSMRNAIIEMGGEFHFHSRMTGIDLADQADGSPRLKAVLVESTADPQAEEKIPADLLVLAIGHSARDTFAMLAENQFSMEPKAFAVGVRVEHPQQMIDERQYGGTPESRASCSLPSAAYKLTANLPNGRGVYTFCMCPGGYVVNASSEPGYLAVNGMSYSGRDGENANSAVIVTVRPEDYPGSGPLSGVEFQRELEKAAYRAGKGKIPVQLFEDFCENRCSEGPGAFAPQIKGSYTWSNLRDIFPEEIAESLKEGILAFDRKIPGYARKDAVMSGVESRTSSPVRILRDKDCLEANVKGVYPCGEGAGYAGGITSAAMDGLKVARMISQTYRPFDKDCEVSCEV